MKKLLFAAIALLGLAAQANAAPLYGYVQITTTTALTPTLQNGSINIASGTIQNLKLTYGVSAATAAFSGPVTVGSLGAAGSQVLISSNAVLPGATFYNGGPSNFSNTENHSGTLNATGTMNATGAVNLGGAGNTVTVSSNTILPGATFYASGFSVRLSTPTIAGPMAMGSNKITGLANGSASTDAVAYGQEQLLQAPIQATQSSVFTTTANTYQAVTNFSASITPTSSASRVEILASGVLFTGNNGVRGILTIKRGSTDLSGNGFATVGAASGGTNAEAVPFAIHYIDSPLTTSATTYQLYLKNSDNSTTVAINNNNETGTIILQETR